MSPGDFRSIVEEYTNLVYGVAYRMMSNAQDAEDVTQETFLSAFRHWGLVQGRVVRGDVAVPHRRQLQSDAPSEGKTRACIKGGPGLWRL